VKIAVNTRGCNAAKPIFFRHHLRRHCAYRHQRHIARASRWERGVAQMQAHGFAGANASLPSSTANGGMTMSAGFGSSNIIAEARRFMPATRRAGQPCGARAS
jgi:hypothetical protein